MIAQLPEIAAAGGLRVEFLDSDGYEEGSVGWGAANCSVTFPDSVLAPFRLTAVFHQENGYWHAVQVHFSVGVTNEERLGLELTTPLQSIVTEVQTDRPDLVGAIAPDGTVTMLFTDIESSTELAEHLGDSDWMELIRWHRRDTTQSAHRNHGYVIKSLGDGFMLAFASASDAIRCARDVSDSAALGWSGHPVRLRAGIHSGQAVRDVDDFYGHSVTVAARVAALAHGGEILVTEVVRELVRGGPFKFDHRRVEPLKGIEKPVEVASVMPG